AVEYNDLLVSDPGLSVFLQDLNSKMEVSVGEALASFEVGETVAVPTDAVPEEGSEEGTPSESEEVVEENPAETSFARTNTSLNVRISDSENADKIGQLSGGVKIEILEKKANGWSKILYENKEAYVKTEYLSIIEDVTKLTPIGKLEAKDTVNVRMAPTTDSDRIGTTYVGEKLDYFELDNNGWAKVNYNQSVGYVKAEYFNKE
ncbi:MAG: SH3 domain-containing protein, partial [Lachnospiraceae bacterium]|nr:SH3 domain-containing protein [Lachnospiraceae bacterium]